METNNKIEFLAIGDIVVDAFITLKNAHVHNGIDKETIASSELCVAFGDKIPYESVDVVNAVGNSPNAAVSASRLGLRSALLATVGGDQNGIDCLDYLKKENIIIDFIKTDENKKTNYHYVLRYGVERTILVKHEEYEYKLPDFGDIQISYIYLSSLADHTLPLHNEIVEYIKKNPSTKLVFQPGTFQMKMGTEILKDVYAHTEIFFCNLEEAQKILNIQTRDIKILMSGIHNLGPKIIAISDGPNGAYASDMRDAKTEIFYIPQYPDIGEPVDRTGAGDAFASTFTSAILLGKTVPEALSWGPINSMSVVQYIGAQKGLLTHEKIEGYLKNAPESYKITKL
ncbi:MAG: carbohydrate kinase family protein [bacterium]|nr:carbohydrate kinase family protein [bacterium]